MSERPSLPGAVFTPQVAVANFSAKPVNATVQFARTDSSGPSATNVATVTVPAMSAQTVALPPLTGDPGLRNSFIVQSNAPPGTFFASVASVGSSGFGLVEQIGKDQQKTDNGGGHPWDLTGGQDAVLLLFNHSTAAKYFNVKIGNGGIAWQQAWQLAPMETRAISIRELIADQVKDKKGAVLPPTLEQGEISWFNPNPAEGKGRLMQIDPSSQTVAGNTRAARNFSCGYNFVLCGAYLDTAAITFADGTSSSPLYLGAVEPMICTAWNPNACSGQSYSDGGSGYNYYWESNVPSVATVYGSSTSSTATFWGVSPGTGGATGFVESAYCDMGGGGTPSVTPTVTISGPLGVPVGGSDVYSVTVSPASNTSSITLSLSTTQGSGSAQFSNGSTSMTITTSQNVSVTGVSASSTANNIQLVAKPQSDSLAILAQTLLSSVSVSISLRSAPNFQVSPDDAGGAAYATKVGSSSLWQVITTIATCSIGVELVGAVTPSNYAGTVVLRRNIVSGAEYAFGSSPISGQNPPLGDDTSGATYRDDNPQSGGSNGKVYDLDAAGIGATSGNGTYRYRANFQEYAVLNSASNTTPASSVFAYYTRSSCAATPALQFATDVAGDNQSGTGTTKTSWNLQ